jgi:hypothetical protein
MLYVYCCCSQLFAHLSPSSMLVGPSSSSESSSRCSSHLHTVYSKQYTYNNKTRLTVTHIHIHNIHIHIHHMHTCNTCTTHSLITLLLSATTFRSIRIPCCFSGIRVVVSSVSKHILGVLQEIVPVRRVKIVPLRRVKMVFRSVIVVAIECCVCKCTAVIVIIVVIVVVVVV